MEVLALPFYPKPESKSNPHREKIEEPLEQISNTSNLQAPLRNPIEFLFPDKTRENKISKIRGHLGG